MKISLSLVLDTFFYFIVFFLMIFIILNYFIMRPVAIVISLCLSALLTLMVFKKLFDKRAKFLQDRKTEKLYKDVITELNFSTPIEQCLLLEKALIKANYQIKRYKNTIKVVDKNAVIFMRFGFESITKTDVVKIFNQLANKEIACVICESFQKEIIEFCDRFQKRIVLVSAKEFIPFLEKHSSLPNQKYALLIPPKKKVGLAQLILKKRAKNFFFFGIFFLFSSYFSPIKWYYVLFGCVFLILSVIVKLFGKDSISP